MPVRTRFAPSPTGVLHLGSVRTALFCWLFARHRSGQFVLRVEDTDRERSTQANVDAILDAMEWLGLDADEGPYFQTRRFDRYREVIDQWLESGKAYYCYCTKEELEELRAAQIKRGENTRYDGRWRDRIGPREGVVPVVRFKNPLEGKVVVNDVVRGKVTFDNRELDDLIIARSDGTPTYNFSVVVDDFDMQISHVVRGDDHLNNTPKQMNMLEALGAPIPTYAHLPMILGPDGSKLSKRHGAVDIREYREQGYLPGAMLNYLVRLGWSHGDQEVFTIDEMVELFDIADINQSASAFNPEKLRWINQQHVMGTDPAVLGEMLAAQLKEIGVDPSLGPETEDVVRVFQERAETLRQMAESARYCYQDFAEIDPKAAKKHLRPVVRGPLESIQKRFDELDTWTVENVESAINEVVVEHGINMGKLGQPLRVAVTGGGVSPPIDATVWLVGKKRVSERLTKALEYIASRAS